MPDLAFKKPGDGISAAAFQDVLGKRVKATVSANHKFTWKDFNDS